MKIDNRLEIGFFSSSVQQIQRTAGDLANISVYVIILDNRRAEKRHHKLFQMQREKRSSVVWIIQQPMQPPAIQVKGNKGNCVFQRKLY